MTRAHVSYSVLGDFVTARRSGSLVELDGGQEQVGLTLAFSEEAQARRFADGVNFAKAGPAHSALTLHHALTEAARLVEATLHEATGGQNYRIAPLEIAGETFDLQVLAFNLRSAADAAVSAVADMEATLASIAADGGAGDAALRAAESLARARGPRRDGELSFFAQVRP